MPKHLRDAHYPGAKRLGHGKGYKYAHDERARGRRPSSTCPTSCVGTEYYRPSDHGNEREVAARLDEAALDHPRRVAGLEFAETRLRSNTGCVVLLTLPKA